MNASELQGRCEFYIKGGLLHGRCCVRLRDGRTVVVTSRRGVPIALLTHTIAQKEAQVSGFFSDVWKGARKAAKVVAKKTLSNDILKQAKALASSDLGSAALSLVPGGSQAVKAIEYGQKAANLLSDASRGVNRAKRQIKKIVALADSGHPEAIKAKKILKAVHKKGKAKGVFPSATAPMVPSQSRRAAPKFNGSLSTYRLGIRGGFGSVGHFAQWMYE